MTVCSRTTVRSTGNRSTPLPCAFFSQLYVKRLHMDSWRHTFIITNIQQGNKVDAPCPKICGAYLSKPALLLLLSISLLERHLNWTAQLIHLLSGCCRLKKMIIIKSCLIFTLQTMVWTLHLLSLLQDCGLSINVPFNCFNVYTFIHVVSTLDICWSLLSAL